LQLPALPTQAAEALAQILPPFVKAANPLDLTGNVVQDTASISRALEAVASAPGTDAIVLFVGLMHSIATAFTDAIAQARRRTHRPIVVIWIGAREDSIAILEQERIPVFRDIPQAVAAIGAAVRLNALRDGALSLPPLPDSARAAAGSGRTATLTEWDSKALLRELGIATIPDGVLVTAKALDRLPAPLSYPIVAKLQARDLLHKSDIGGVVLNIETDAQLDAAVRHLWQIAGDHRVDAQGILLESMQPYEHELLLGLRRDAKFGPTLTLGRGGVDVELDADVSTRLLPLDETHIRTMIESLRSARLFQGFRGREAVDISALSRHIVRLCHAFARRPDLAEVEINPLAVRDGDAWVLDAVVSRYQ
jgi:acyl-CoA synthetase (NDP forming)